MVSMKILDKKAAQYVSMANELIKAAHNLTLMEKRVLMLAISKIDSKAKPNVNSLVKLTVHEFVAEFGINEDSAYREIKKAVKGVRRRYARFFSIDTDGQPLEHDIDWTTRANYKDTEGWIEVSINGDLNPYLYELKSHFTTYKLSRASALRSIYSWRLFELLMQFKKTGLVNIGINEFNHSLEVPDTYKQDFSLLRMRVIEPAVKEIREKDGLLVEWEAIKAGRKVKALKFTFPTEQQLKLDTEPKHKELTKKDATPAPASPKAEPDIMPLADTKTRLEGARALANAVNAPIETYLTARDRASIEYHKLTI